MAHRIAVIPGDGIGKEVVPEGIRVLEAAGKRFGFDFEWTTFDWSCERYAKTGAMMPDDGFQQYINLRPVRLLPGAKSPLAGRTSADIDMIIVRENNEGEYSEIGGRLN